MKIKKFRGATENAVRIQIGTPSRPAALSRLSRKKLESKQTTYELLQILSVFLMDKTSLNELFEKQRTMNRILIPRHFFQALISKKSFLLNLPDTSGHRLKNCHMSNKRLDESSIIGLRLLEYCDQVFINAFTGIKQRGLFATILPILTAFFQIRV